MNVSKSDIAGASLNRRLPAYETYRPRFDATCLFSRGIMYSVAMVTVTFQNGG